jgi:hypothetical protein
MVEYFWESVFGMIEKYWINTKSPHILIYFEDKNTEEVNKPLLRWTRISSITCPVPC